VKKLFKLLSLLRLVKELRGHRRYSHGHHGGFHRRSRDYYPLHHRHTYRRSGVERVLSRLLGGHRN
jgi:hypothetical protein